MTAKAGEAGAIVFRRAGEGDLPVIVRLLADDGIGKSREIVSDPPDARYVQAFREIDADPNQILAVADDGGHIVGFLQISFIPGLSRAGMRRGQIEGVRVAADRRGTGLGRRFLDWAIGRCRDRGCALVQLTSDKRRADALRFYEGLGFRASHEGLKLEL